MLLECWSEDLRLAARGLSRSKAFAGAAVLTLALGIAGTTVMSALIEGVLLRPLPVPDQGRLIVGWKEFPSGASVNWPFRSSEVDAIRRESRLLERVGAVSSYGARPGIVFENGSAVYLSAVSVGGTFFDVFGVQPLLGRALRRQDDLTGAEGVLVITHALWRSRYGGSPDVIGRRVMIKDHPFTIVGVMPPDFAYPRGVEAWMTLTADASKETNPRREGILRDVDLVARLRPGVTVEEARGELQGLAAGLDAAAPPDTVRGLRPVVRSYADVVVGDVRRAMLVLFAAVGLVLLIASANVANLLLLRGESRRTELAVRAALGAGRARLARQLLAESLLLAFTAGFVGLAASRWLLRVTLALVPGGLPRVESIRIDPVVVLFTFGVALLAAALAGVAPALFASRLDLATHLRGARQLGAGGVRRGRRGLVVAQVALAVTIVAAAGLLVRTLSRLLTADMGLAADRLVLVSLRPSATKHPGGPRPLSDFIKEVTTQLESVPGIEGATPVHTPPFAGTGGWDAPEFTAEGQSHEQAERNPPLNLEAVYPNYFATIQVPFVRGRAFTEDDRAGAPEVVIVSEDLAARAWPGQDPIGKRLKLGRLESKEKWQTWRAVVGVVKPTRYRELAEPRPTLYLPAPQFVVSGPMFLLRTTLTPAAVAALTHARLQAVDPNVDVMRVTPFSQLLEAPLARPRFNAFLIGVFGAAALLLVAIGLYAVMAAYVRQRYPEIGIRVALGATTGDVCRLVLGEGMRLAGLGAAIGLGGAVAGARVLRGLLFGVHPIDPTSLLSAVVLLVSASMLACALPAWRATRVDPAVALRTT